MSTTFILGRDETRYLATNGLLPNSHKGMKFDDYITGYSGRAVKFRDGEFIVTFEDDQEAVMFKLLYSDKTVWELIEMMLDASDTYYDPYIDSLRKYDF